jgi:hypothetical protein
MDIDTIQALVEEGAYLLSEEFKERMDQREFNLEQALAVVRRGMVIEERSGEKPYPKCTLASAMLRNVAGVQVPDELRVALAIGPRILFITGYWKGDRPSRKAHKR